ncbi:MAG: sugar phosphate isomerase/epimerase [Bryobacterales bacterium]|nr:sugar phosphate isomerase/epimerase [Bryobacterales bacterium]MDE0264145.1 sugar phosphate isomerase/epimerase [Bryobacterales bacterium]
MKSTTRRSFLGTAAVLPAASAAAASTQQAGNGAGPHHWDDLKLAVATYSLRKFSRSAAIDICRHLGVKYVNVKSFHMPYYLSADDLMAARKEFEKAGLEVVAGGNISLRSDDSDELEHYFKYAVAAGMPIMVCAPTHSNLGAIEKLAIKYDRKMAIHNHGPEDKFYPAPSDVIKRVKNMDPRMGLCVDVGHTVRTGADILEEIDGAWDRIYDFHVKDLTDFTSKESRVDVGDGKMPIAAIFKMLKERKYQGVVGLEYEVVADHPQLGMAKSFSYMRGVLDGQA